MKYLDAWSYTEWFNLLGTPACGAGGKSPEGLPIGVQIVARPWQEELVISVAARWKSSAAATAPPFSHACSSWLDGVDGRLLTAVLERALARGRDSRPPFVVYFISGMTKRSLLLCASACLWPRPPFLLAAPDDSHSKPRSRRSRTPEQPGRGLHEPAAFREGAQGISGGWSPRSQLQIAFLNQGIALLNLARIEPAKVLLEAAGKERSQRSSRLVQPGIAVQEFRQSAGIGGGLSPRHRDRSQ